MCAPRYTNEDNGLKGLMITAMDFVSPSSGYATALSALQVCDLLGFTA